MELTERLTEHPGMLLCSECVEDMEAGHREDFEVNLASEACVYCHGGVCESHGREYPEGMAHEVCHELPDYTRADDGSY